MGDRMKDKIIEINGKFYLSVGGVIGRELDIQKTCEEIEQEELEEIMFKQQFTGEND